MDDKYLNNLPKVNERKELSNAMQLKLEISLRDMISTFEKENKYEFKSYEIDNIFLGIVKKNHETYLRSEFGTEF
ncbi:hypothetical protein [Plebeiibacterium sediminum]|uniref:Uncharacterized protein n=1 Tax=Plebeiibacterium sediminum TaxID=2992112 RepID=A0AAE3SDK3_9BACT|nr:hypothetical protein [Plebeiobacterium sediminum]MCW3784922.1 hypothetical protein [Plebeiobacterium sediminum]